LLPGSQDRVADATVESAGVGEVFEVEAVGEETGDGGRADTSDSADVVGGITDQGSSVAPLGRATWNRWVISSGVMMRWPAAREVLST
jgi:hypothetical protein